MKKIGVLQLSKYYKPYLGGIERVVEDISEGITAPVTVLACSAEAVDSRETMNSVHVVRAKSWAVLASTPISPSYLVEAISRINGQLLHIHQPNPMSALAVFVAWMLQKDISKIVVHWHSDIVKQRLSLVFYRPLMNWMLRKAKKIIVTSQAYLEGSDQLRAFKDTTVVIPIGIDSLASQVDDAEVERIRKEYPRKSIVLALGRHIYYKGFEYLIEAASELEGCVFLIGGIGPDTDSYKRRISSLGLTDRVIMLGKIPEASLASYYSAADVFCLPSIEKSEAYGVVQLEAMSVGTPVICTDIVDSGVPWVNLHGVSGLVCKPRDVDSLRNALKQILTDDKLRILLGEGALKRYQLLFTKEKMIEKVEGVYADIMVSANKSTHLPQAY